MAFTRTQVDPFALPASVRAKWPDELLGEGFVPLPKKVLRALSVLFGGSPEIEELVAVLAVVDYKRANPAPAPTLAYLAFVAGLSPSRLNAALSRLKQRDWAKIDLDPAREAVDVNVDGLNGAVLSILRQQSRAGGED